MRSEHFDRLLRDRARVLEKFYATNASPEALAIKPVAFRNLYQELTVRQLAAHRWRGAGRAFLQTCRVAPNPLTAALRVVFVAFFYMYLSKTNWGVHFVDTLTAARRQKRPGE